MLCFIKHWYGIVYPRCCTTRIATAWHSVSRRVFHFSIIGLSSLHSHCPPEAKFGVLKPNGFYVARCEALCQMKSSTGVTSWVFLPPSANGCVATCVHRQKQSC